MALFQNSKIAELENRVSELTMERNNLKYELETLQSEGVTLQKYEQMAQEIRRLKVEVGKLNNKTADYSEQIKYLKFEIQTPNLPDESKSKKEIENLKAQIEALQANSKPLHNMRGAGRKCTYTKEDMTLIISLSNQGYSIGKIYKAVDERFSKSTIQRIIKNAVIHN